eukprot:EG_transcript_13517
MDLLVVCFLLLPCTRISALHGSDLSAADIAAHGAPFARVSGHPYPLQWKHQTCPLEVTSFSCYWHNFTRGWELEHRPIPGAHRPFLLAAFESLIRCRDLLLIGDSLIGQFYQTLACLLRRPDTQFTRGWQKLFHDGLCPFGEEHCRLMNGCTEFPHLSARICFSQDAGLEVKLSRYGLRRGSVVVANAAYHHYDQGPFAQVIDRFAEDYAQLPNLTRPVLVWAEAPPQHFPEHPSGYYQGRHLQFTRCAPVDKDSGYAHDWRNRIAERRMTAAGIPILRLWNLTQPLWDYHVVHSGRTDPTAKPVDCTHYCLPGAPVLWAVALTDLLETLITPKGAQCRHHPSTRVPPH